MTVILPTGSTSRIASTAPMPAAEAPTITYFAISTFHLGEHQRFIRAVGNTRGLLESLAEIAFCDNFAVFIHLYSTVGANHDAGPAANAPFPVMGNLACFPVFLHGTREASGNAGCIFAMTALDGKGDWFVSFHCYSAYWFRAFAVVGFDYVF
jgi:hypothetical protein